MKKKTIYICGNCNYESIGYMGKCPECNSWNTMEETQVLTKKGNSSAVSKKRNIDKDSIKRLKEIETSNSDRIVTTIGEFNRVMGGGIIKDSEIGRASCRERV